MEPGSVTPLVASASTPDPQALMAAYPFASSTPSAHVSRHLNSLTGASSIPSFVGQGQQSYQIDPQARQYAARALQMEAQQGAYQGYAPPARWAPSDYNAPAGTYGQYSYGGQQNYGGHVAQQQQAQYPPSAQTSSSQYQYSSSQSYSQSAAYPFENQRSASQQQHQHSSSASVHPSSNLKPQSQSQVYTQQQYPTQASRTSASATSSDPSGHARSTQAQYQGQGSFAVQQQQSKQPSYPSQGSTSYNTNASYPSQTNTTSTYPTQPHTASSYSQPPSTATSYPTQSNSAALTHSRSAPSDSISSNFLAPLASHQFAPRLSQPVSTLPRHSSDSRALYSADGRKTYPTEPQAAYSSDGRQLYSNAGGEYSSNAGKAYPTGLGRAHSTGAGAPYPAQNVQRSTSLNQHSSGFQQGLGLSHGHGHEARGSRQHATALGARQEQNQTGCSNLMQRQASGSYSGAQHGQPGGAHQGQYQGGYQKQSQVHQNQARAQAEGPSSLNQQQQQAQYARLVQQARQTQAAQNAWSGQVADGSHSGHGVQHAQSGQNPQQSYRVQPNQDGQYAQLSKAHSQAQYAGHYAQPQPHVHASREQLQQQQRPQSQQSTSSAHHSQPQPSQSQQAYGAAQAQAQVQSYAPQAAQQEPAPSQFVADSRFSGQVVPSTQGHSQSPQVQQQSFQPQPQLQAQIQPQPTQAQTQSQPQPTQSQPQPQPQAMPLPQPARTQSQSQSQPRPIYAPLASRSVRGRGMGRPIAGSQRVLQGGPPRVLTPVQLAQGQGGMQNQQQMMQGPQVQGAQVQGAQAQRTTQAIPVRQMQHPSGYGMQPPVRAQVQQVGQAYPGQQQYQTHVVNTSVAYQTPAQPQQPESAANQQESAGDTSMEYVGAAPQTAQPSVANAYHSTVSDANTTYPDSPPPPYEPLMRDRAKGAQEGLVQGQGQAQEANGYATQQLSLQSNPPTPQPPTLRPEQANQIPQSQPQVAQQQQTTRQPPAPAPRKHTVQDSAAHFDAFLSAGASTAAPEKAKPSQPMKPAPSKKSVPPPRPLPTKTASTSSSSSLQRPRLSPVVELSQRSAFMTPRKEKKWREPRKDLGSDSPPKRDTDSPDPTSLSPSKRKREPEAETGGRTVKRMMSMSIESTQTPTAGSRMYDATMRTPGSSMRAPGKFSTMPSRMRLVVEVPSRKRVGGGSPGDMHSSPDKSRLATGGMSTGKRDAHLEKLCSLIDDIIEAEDTLDPEAAAENGGPADWFSPMTSDWSAPLLAPSVIGRLTQLASRRGLRLSEVDTGNLTRILKMLGRSVAKGEDLDPFGSLLGGAGPSSAAKPKAKGKKKAKGAAEEEGEAEEPKEEVELGEEDFARLTRSLEAAKEAVVAADCVVAILSADRLPKQMYSEDLITSCFGAVKNQLSSIIYPYVETASDVHGHSPPLLLHVAQSTSSFASEHRTLLGEIFRNLNAALPRITALANHGISETMVIQAAFIGIGPFFVVEATPEKNSKSSAAEKKNGTRFHVLDALGGSTSMRGLRLAALGLVRALFAGYESQRAWIVEEILGSLIKLPDMKLKAGQFKLRDGATIHVVSALLFQLVQTSAHDVRIHAQKLARKRREALADANTTSFVEGGKTPLLDEHDREETHLYLNGLESATKTAKTIVFFLTQRSGKNKNTKSTNEAEYRSIFDNLIQDILVVLNWPEWPAANLLMSIVCKFMLSALEDVKSSTDSAAKNIALDHLGEIATRLRETHLTLQLPFATVVKPLDEIVASCDLKALDDLIGAHSDIYAHLSKRASDDQAYDSARELTAATWAQELATSLRQCDSILSKVHEDEDMEEATDAKLPELATKIKTALRNVWSEGVNDMFEAGTDAEVKRVDDLAERFGGTQSLRNAFEPILGAILMALDAPAVFMRTKALRALGLIVTKDSSILKQANVRRAIESHLMDSSPAVRDAAVELIGKYLVLSPELVDDYYPQIANRIADTGLAVRKRVIKLLKSLYGLTDNHARRVDICTKLVFRLLDEDDGIKDLAISSIEELWFTDANESNTGRRGIARDNNNSASGQMTSKISVIMGVNANFRDRHSPLEDMLHEIIAKKNDKDAAPIVQRYVDVCDALTDSLVDAQEIPGFSVVNCIRTVHVFTAAHPTVMSTRKAVILLPYLKSGSTADDQAIADYLLKIFRSCIPRMPAGTSKFGTELQQTLEPMVIKPSGAAGVAALPETVACLCAVVHHITHDYQRLVALLRSCNGRLVQVLAKQNQPTAQEIATLSILALIVSLLGEHSDFDKIRGEQPALKPSIDAIKDTSIAEYIYGLIHRLYQRFNDPLLQGRLLQCFGFLFRAHPTLLTHDDSAEMMDAIFASPQEDAQARLLKIMQDFLLSEASKHSHATTSNKKKGGAVDMDELIGNTDGFADSGVSSAIIQRYLTQILSSALSSNRFIQAPAVDILSFTVRQGLAHPLQCFPIIVALETSHDNSLSSRASNLHTLLHNKHASLLNSRYLESVGRSLEYQKQLQPGSWKGYRLSPHPTALLHRWYSLVKEKRQPKLDFLKSFLRAFDVDVAVLSCSQDHFDLVRYIAENMSAFDYKTQEEILTVIRHLTHVLSVAGMHVVEILHQERRAQEASGSAMEIDAPPEASSDGLARARVVTIISIVLVLKAHLKHLYGITEEKASRWVPGKKTAAGDKPAAVRHDKPISWERVTFATRIGQTLEDIRVQEEQLLVLWAEDGVTAEPDDFGD